MDIAKAAPIALAMLSALAAASPATAKIKCQDGAQLVQGNWLATPYCQDKLLFEVANARGFKTSFAAIRNNPNHKKDFARLKGLGEMDAEELRITTMDPEFRTLLQINGEQAALADEVMSILMGEDVESRKQFIVTNAKDVRFLDV